MTRPKQVYLTQEDKDEVLRTIKELPAIVKSLEAVTSLEKHISTVVDLGEKLQEVLGETERTFRGYDEPADTLDLASSINAIREALHMIVNWSEAPYQPEQVSCPNCKATIDIEHDDLKNHVDLVDGLDHEADPGRARRARGVYVSRTVVVRRVPED